MLSQTYDNGAFLSVSFMEVDHLFEGEITNDVRIEHEERIVRRSQYFSSQSQRSGGSERFTFVWKRQRYAQLLRWFQMLLISQLHHNSAYRMVSSYLVGFGSEFALHLLGSVRDGQDNLSDSSFQQCLDLMHEHGLVGKLHQRLRSAQGQRTQASAVAADENQGLHLAEFNIYTKQIRKKEMMRYWNIFPAQFYAEI